MCVCKKEREREIRKGARMWRAPCIRCGTADTLSSAAVAATAERQQKWQPKIIRKMRYTTLQCTPTRRVDSSRTSISGIPCYSMYKCDVPVFMRYIRPTCIVYYIYDMPCACYDSTDVWMCRAEQMCVVAAVNLQSTVVLRKQVFLIPATEQTSDTTD